MLYSDGATDVRDRAGEPFGTEALEHLASTAPAHNAAAFLDYIADNLVAHAGQNQLDDIALLAIKVHSDARG